MLKVKMTLFLSLIAMVYATNAYFSHRIMVELDAAYTQGRADFDQEEKDNSFNYYVEYNRRLQKAEKQIRAQDARAVKAKKPRNVWQAAGME